MRAGAINYIEKPFREQHLWESIQEALRCDAENRRVLAKKGLVRRRLAKLTPAERKVLDRLLEGRANKDIAAELEVSVRTVEVRRAKIMEKMRAESLAELIRFTLEASLSARTLPSGG
jgi:FixJ family two-component response regulator